MEFVISNAKAKADNVTSVHFSGEAMGFFGGMTAAHMSKTNQVGVIASFTWQPEVDGFIKGAKYENPDIEVNTKYTDHWPMIRIFRVYLYIRIFILGPFDKTVNLRLPRKGSNYTDLIRFRHMGSSHSSKKAHCFSAEMDTRYIISFRFRIGNDEFHIIYGSLG